MPSAAVHAYKRRYGRSDRDGQVGPAAIVLAPPIGSCIRPNNPET